MYRWIRNTHLLAGLFSFLFLLVYGVSAVQMSHNAWFTTEPQVTESRAAVHPENGADARAVARALMDSHGLRGELNEVKKTAAGYRFRITRPGTVYEVDYSPQTGEAVIRTNVANFIGMLNRLHHIRGFRHEYWLLIVWGSLVGLVSVALILIGLTGIYLWFRMHQERVIGTILLAISLGYSLILMILMRDG
jgi:hypothetical protein